MQFCSLESGQPTTDPSLALVHDVHAPIGRQEIIWSQQAEKESETIQCKQFFDKARRQPAVKPLKPRKAKGNYLGNSSLILRAEKATANRFGC